MSENDHILRDPTKIYPGPMGRPGQPAELASIYVQPAAADASYAAGQIYGSAGDSDQP